MMALSKVGHLVTSDITHGSVLTPSHQRQRLKSKFVTANEPPYYSTTLTARLTLAKYLICQHQMVLKTNLFKLEVFLKKIDAQPTTYPNQMDSVADQVDIIITLRSGLVAQIW
jgi:hypothetical protein